MKSRQTIRPVTFFDAALIASLVAGSLLFLPFLRNSRPETVAITKDNETIATYPLSSDCRVVIRGRIGPMELEIKNRAVRVVSSTCPRQIICSPNHILIQIVSSRKDGLDAVTR
jgi:hypothetical protein